MIVPGDAASGSLFERNARTNLRPVSTSRIHVIGVAGTAN